MEIVGCTGRNLFTWLISNWAINIVVEPVLFCKACIMFPEIYSHKFPVYKKVCYVYLI